MLIKDDRLWAVLKSWKTHFWVKILALWVCTNRPSQYEVGNVRGKDFSNLLRLKAFVNNDIRFDGLLESISLVANLISLQYGGP